MNKKLNTIFWILIIGLKVSSILGIGNTEVLNTITTISLVGYIIVSIFLLIRKSKNKKLSISDFFER